MHVLRNLEPGYLVLAVHLNVVFRERHAVRRDDERRRLFAVLLRRAADDRNVLDAGHGTEEILDLLRRDVFAAADDEILETSGDIVVAVLVHASNVAGMKPAVLVDALRRLFGHLVVALHVVEAAAADLAIRIEWRDLAGFRIDDRHLDAGKRLADRLTLALDGLLEVARHGHHRPSLG